MTHPHTSTSSQNGVDHLAAELTALALLRTGACFVFQNEDLEITLIRNLPSVMIVPEGRNVTDPDLFGEDEAARLLEIKKHVRQSGVAQAVEIEMPSGNGALIFRIQIERFDQFGTRGVLSIISDVTDSRHRERVLKTLLRELSHRSKNLLAIIQGIATQTARQARSLDSFLVNFRGRIQSLSNSQDLVTDSSWRGAFLFELANRQFSPYWPNPAVPINLQGINAHLSPNAALHVGLALHELIVNSASHGAISMGNNALRLCCVETEFENQQAMLMSWVEQRPQRTDPEGEDHTFARTVLERVVPIALGGKSVYITEADRIEYHLTIPQREFELIEP